MTTLPNPSLPSSAAPWTVFVPGQVRLYRQVVIASRPLKRDNLLTEMDVLLAERDVGLLNQGYLTSLQQAIGKKLTRALLPDQVLAPVHVQQAEVIRKGDQVVISARSGGISVRMPGEALTDGVAEDLITAHTNALDGVLETDITFVCVGTPTKTYGVGAGRAADLRFIESVARTIAELRSMPDVRLFPRTTVFGTFDDGVYGAVERVNDHLPVPPEFQPLPIGSATPMPPKLKPPPPLPPPMPNPTCGPGWNTE